MSREPQRSRVSIDGGGAVAGGKAPSSGKSGGSRMAVYIVVFLLALGGAAYMWFGRDKSGPAPDPEATQHTADIQNSQPAPTSSTPVMPVEGRPPRGHPMPPPK